MSTRLRDNIRNLLDLHSPQVVPGTEAPVKSVAPRDLNHSSNCLCDQCFSQAVAYLDYLKAKKAYRDGI